MSKKKNINEYFNNLTAPKVPSTKTLPPQNEEVRKTYSTHKIFESPEIENRITLNDQAIVLIDPEEIKNWEFHDRPENELGDIDSLAREFIEIGQQQPCIVRNIIDKKYKYELIVGERRWLASKRAKIKLKTIIKDLSDTEAALCQAAENSQRKDLSDYAKGMSYARLIDKGILRQSDLTQKLGISRQQVSRLLSFRDIPEALIEAIKDLSKVSARTAEEIRLMYNKDPSCLDALIKFADKIRSGVGYETLKKYYEKTKEQVDDYFSNAKVLSKDGRHLFTWRKDGNGYLSISFPKNIRNTLNIIDLESDFANCIESQIQNYKLSPAGDKNRGKKMKT